MATLTRVKVKHATCGRMLGALSYVLQTKKVTFSGIRVETGHNCTPQTSYVEMMATKQSFRKTDGVSFLHYVHSFSDKEIITPWQANEIARELAEKLFPDNECVIATHNDTDNLHSHIIRHLSRLMSHILKHFMQYFRIYSTVRFTTSLLQHVFRHYRQQPFWK